MGHAESSPITLEGIVEPQFAPVRDAFVAGFDQSQELGAAVAVYHRSKLVVDLAAGLRARGSQSKYSRETLQPIFSATKGITALAANMLADRGQLDLDAPVVDYWPEFAQAGKFWIPVRCLLTHQSGLLGLDEPISLEQLILYSTCGWCSSRMDIGDFGEHRDFRQVFRVLPKTLLPSFVKSADFTGS